MGIDNASFVKTANNWRTLIFERKTAQQRYDHYDTWGRCFIDLWEIWYDGKFSIARWEEFNVILSFEM